MPFKQIVYALNCPCATQLLVKFPMLPFTLVIYECIVKADRIKSLLNTWTECNKGIQDSKVGDKNALVRGGSECTLDNMYLNVLACIRDH